jgi:hypothetical protein
LARDKWLSNGPPSAIGFMFRINMEHYSCDIAPVSTIDLCVEQAQIRDEVFLVVDGQHRIGRRGIGDIGIKRRLLHGRSRNRLLIDQLCFGLLGILMTAKPGAHQNPRCWTPQPSSNDLSYRL